MSISTVRIYINSALEYIDSPYRVDDVEPNLVQAEQRLANIDPAEAAPFYQQIAEIRARLDDIVKPADARQVSAAQGKIRQARDYIDTNRGQLNQGDKDYVEELFRMAEQFLGNITDERKADRLKAPVRAEMDQIRAQYGTNQTAPPPPPPKPVAPPPSQGYQDAKRAVFWANEYFDSPGRLDQVEPELVKAEGFLQGDLSNEAEELRGQIAALREKIADTVSPQDESAVRMARLEISNVREYMDRQREFLNRGDTKQNLEDQLQRIIDGTLSRIKHPRKGDELKAPLLAEINRIRAEIGAIPAPSYQRPQESQSSSYYQSQPQSQPQSRGVPVQAQQQQYGHYQSQPSAPPPATRAPVDATSTIPPSYEDQNLLNRARRTLGQARNNIESRRTEGVENLFFDATNTVAPVDPAHKASLLDEIEQLRRDLENTRLAENTRSLTSELDRRLDGVREDVNYPDRLKYSLMSFTDRFGREDVRRTLTDSVYRDYESRLASILAEGQEKKKREILEERAKPALQKLQDRLATNPFSGLQHYEANKVDGELRSMRWAVEKELNQLPEGDADRERLFGELKGTDDKFAAYSNEWGKEEIYQSMRNQWQIVKNIIDGWQDEQPAAATQPLEDPNMPKTRLAVQRVHYFLHDDSSINDTRSSNPGDSVIASIDREAQSLFDAAANKLASAFYAIVDAAEAMETPIEDRWMREKASLLVGTAQGSFENTSFYEPVMARVNALDQRWKDELAAVQKAREELCAKLSRENREKWPAIAARIQTVGGPNFDPYAAKPGDAVHLGGVYNRAGWDFGADSFGFSMRLNGVPLGGIYEDYIGTAMEYAAYHQKLRIDDHEDWDLVGVVLGWGKIRERTTTRIRRDYSSQEETIEEWLPVDCLRMKVIALRAGPVLAGPPN